MSKENKCLIPSCTRLSASRGLCISCRNHATKLIKDGSVTEDDLLKAGAIKPSNRFLDMESTPMHKFLVTAGVKFRSAKKR